MTVARNINPEDAVDRAVFAMYELFELDEQLAHLKTALADRGRPARVDAVWTTVERTLRNVRCHLDLYREQSLRAAAAESIDGGAA